MYTNKQICIPERGKKTWKVRNGRITPRVL